MTAGVATKGKIGSLEGLRGTAILLVFLVHYTVAWTLLFPTVTPHQSVTAWVADVVFSLGNAGVDLFMALSGYLIYDHLMQRPQPFRTYAARRIRRIYPAYLVTVAIYLALMLVDPAKSKLPHGAFDAALYVVGSASLLPGLFPDGSIVGIAWSLSYEIDFYLLLPLGIWLFGFRARSVGFRVAVLFGVMLVLLLNALSIGYHERVIMFVGGMLAREALFRSGNAFARPRLVEAAAAAALVAGIAYMALCRGSTGYAYPAFPASILRAVVLFVVFPMLLAASIGVDGMCRRVFEWAPLRWLGEVSFSFYLMHNLAMRVALPAVRAHVTPPMAETFYWLAMPLAFVLCLGPALALYVSVERPISLRRSPASPAGGQAAVSGSVARSQSASSASVSGPMPGDVATAPSSP